MLKNNMYNVRRKKNTNTRTGLSLVEILVAASIFLGAVVAFTGTIQVFFDLARHSAEVTQAGILLEEGGEAVQLLRDYGWDTHIETLELGTPYYLYWDGSMYTATSSEVIIQNNFTRTITITSVERNASDVITFSGGTEDSGTRLVTIQIFNAAEDRLIAAADALIHNIYAQ